MHRSLQVRWKTHLVTFKSLGVSLRRQSNIEVQKEIHVPLVPEKEERDWVTKRVREVDEAGGMAKRVEKPNDTLLK